MSQAVELSRKSISSNSKSFALASVLLPAAARDDVAVLYAWCRQCDDAVDLAPHGKQAHAMQQLFAELDVIYGPEQPQDVLLAAIQDVFRRHQVPREYPQELLCGMEMDVQGFHYRSLEDLLLYCYRVAGTVGLMMCHILGVSQVRALRHAVHLGMAMQLTNICRDVLEDWGLRRLYLPEDLLTRAGAPNLRAHGAFPERAQAPVSVVVQQLLAEADRAYASADLGVRYLPWQASVAVHAARWIYSGIGRLLAGRHFDVTAGRAVVPGWMKMALLLRSCVVRLATWPRRFRPVQIETVIHFPADVLPL